MHLACVSRNLVRPETPRQTLGVFAEVPLEASDGGLASGCGEIAHVFNHEESGAGGGLPGGRV